jgi:hypothetical protein
VEIDKEKEMIEKMRISNIEVNGVLEYSAKN